MGVFLANEQDLAVQEARLSALARHALARLQVEESAELSVILVAADHMRQLNRRFAGNDYSTDVLSFPMEDEEDGPSMLGDVVLCPQVAQRNAIKLEHSLDDELAVLLVHGTLHLLGYDHQRQEEADDMEKTIREVVGSFETPVP